MREQSWRHRRISNEHYRWFQNLIDLHSMTNSWLEDLNVGQSTSHQLKRVISPDLRESMNRLDLLAQNTLPEQIESIIGDSLPEELLQRLEKAVWTVQALTLRVIFERTPSEEFPAMKNLLEQSCWKSGRKCCQKRWKSLPIEAKQDLRGIFAALLDSPLAGHPGERTFLIKRSIATELQVELLICPHQSPLPDIRFVADTLCGLHGHWLRGFVYAINTTAIVEYIQRKSETENRCTLRWFFHLSDNFSSRL